MVLKFNNKQSLNQILKKTFETLLKRGFLPAEKILLIALEQVSISKFLNVKEFGLCFLAGHFVLEIRKWDFGKRFLAKLEDKVLGKGGKRAKSRQILGGGAHGGRGRYTSAKRTFSKREVSRTGRRKSKKAEEVRPVWMIVGSILEQLRDRESNMKTHKLISKYVKLYQQNLEKSLKKSKNSGVEQTVNKK